MKPLNQVMDAHQKNIDDVLSWCEEMYQSNFAKYFTEQRQLYKRLQSKRSPITDDELEDILTSIPLQLFTVSEEISRVHIMHRVVKLRIKEIAAEVEKHSNASTATARKEEAAIAILEDKLLELAYSTILERVEHEMSFSRELIMGAKKIWDARRRTDEANPVTEHSEMDTLPEYTGQTYIK